MKDIFKFWFQLSIVMLGEETRSNRQLLLDGDQAASPDLPGLVPDVVHLPCAGQCGEDCVPPAGLGRAGGGGGGQAQGADQGQGGDQEGGGLG